MCAGTKEKQLFLRKSCPYCGEEPGIKRNVSIISEVGLTGDNHVWLRFSLVNLTTEKLTQCELERCGNNPQCLISCLVAISCCVIGTTSFSIRRATISLPAPVICT